MRLARLIAALEDAGFAPDAPSLLDALWLAAQFTTQVSPRIRRR